MKKLINKRKRSYTSYLFMLALSGCFGLLTACSSDDALDGGDPTGADVRTVGVEVSNDPSDFDGRITLYKGETRGLTRTAGAYVTMPEQPSVPADAEDVTASGFQNWNFANRTLYVKPDAKATLHVEFNHTNIYVAGELELGSVWGNGNANIYILPGGKLTWPNGNGGLAISNLAIYNYGGTFEWTGDNFTMNATTTYMTSADFAVTGEARIQGTLYVGGNFAAGKLDQSYGWSNDGLTPYVTVRGNVTLTQSSSVSSGSLYVGGALTGTTLNETGGTTQVTVGCSATLSEKLYITGGSTLYATNGAYIKAPATEISANSWESGSCSTLAASDGTLLDLGNLKLCNVDINRITVVGDNSKAVVIAKDICINNEDLTQTFTCPGEGSVMGLQYESLSGTNNVAYVEFVSNIKTSAEELASISIPATEGCSPGYNADGDDEPSAPVIDQIADIDANGHSHDISATCVQIVGDKAYLSWHARGTSQSGCLEVVDHSDKNAPKLVSFMRSNIEELEYNHLIVDNNRVYAVGNSKKGGILATIALNSDGIFTPSSETVDTAQLSYVLLKPSESGKSSDGNCIVRQGDDFLVTTSVGFETFDASTLNRTASVYTQGSAKHIALDGDNMVTLNLAGQNTSGNENNPLGATINLWNAADHAFASPLATWTADMIVPTNGKNVCKIDGQNVYACLGQNGFVRYDLSGNKTGEFKLDKIKLNGETITGGSVNGMDFDDKYIYIAYGSYGVRVLDKTTLNEVASYRFSGGKSANYVKATADGYVYVAYGKSGLKIFRIR